MRNRSKDMKSILTDAALLAVMVATMFAANASYLMQ